VFWVENRFLKEKTSYRDFSKKPKINLETNFFLVVENRDSWFFLLKTHFQRKTPRNYPSNLFNIQKRKKPVKNPKSTWKPISFLSQIWFLGTFNVKKKTLKSNFPHHMELLGTKI
jgi:hypothetical protein